MAKEIERKFLVINDSFVESADCVHTISQGYLAVNNQAVVRVRLFDDKGFLTVKSKTVGFSRDEWEYEIPASDAREMLSLCRPGTVLSKKRYVCGDWEVDVFEGVHKGLIIAEIELSDESQTFDLPSFIGQEVTGDPRYYNSNLARLAAL